MKKLCTGLFIALLSTGLISCETEHLEPVPTEAILVAELEDNMLVSELEDNMREEDQEDKQGKTKQKGTGN